MSIALGNAVQVVIKKTRGASEVVAVFDTPEAAQRFMEITAMKHPGTYEQVRSLHFKL